MSRGAGSFPVERRQRAREGEEPSERYQTLAERCITSFANHAGPVMLPSFYNSNYQIVQGRDSVAILVEMIHDVRIVRLNSRHSGVQAWYGDSIGHYEGDTLVVDTIGFNDKFWFDFRGHPHTEKLHTVERYTRKDLGTIVVETTIDDPGVYTKPFTISFTGRLRPGEELMEYICQENEQDAVHIKGPAGTP